MNPAETVEQQLEAYLAGSLCRAEAKAFERRITSEPAVARAYADAKLQADASAACDESPHDEACETHQSGLIGRICRFFGGQSD